MKVGKALVVFFFSCCLMLLLAKGYLSLSFADDRDFPLETKIILQDNWGRSFADSSGLLHYHDRAGAALMTHDKKVVLPKNQWGLHKLYYLGTKAPYKIVLRNTAPHAIYDLDITAQARPLLEARQWGGKEKLFHRRNWTLNKIDPGQIVILSAEMQSYERIATHVGQLGVVIKSEHQLSRLGSLAIWCPRP